MKYTTENDYGCTLHSGVSDMSTPCTTLTEQLQQNGIEYTSTGLDMGIDNTHPCHLIHYTSTKTRMPMTVLVIPRATLDTWAEEYYYFPEMTCQDARLLDWYEVYQHVRTISQETTRARMPTSQYCPTCDKIVLRTYDDIRGRKRCSACYTLTH